MMKGILSLILFYAFSLACPTLLIAAEESLKEYLEKASDHIKAHRHFEAADALKEATKIGGTKHPSLHMRLGILYYELGLLPEAIDEGEKAVALSPSSKWYKYDLAKFLFANQQYKRAEDQLVSLLKEHPGFAFGYHYLAELYFRNSDYDMAWLCFRRACLLGLRGKHLEEKLRPHSSKAIEDLDQFPEDSAIFRFIKFSSEEGAKETLKELYNGKLFESIELSLKKENIQDIKFGIITLPELQKSALQALPNIRPYSQPVIVISKSDFRIIQRIAPFDPVHWKNSLAAPASTAVVTTRENKEDARQFPPEKSKEQLATQLAAYYALESWKNAWQAADIAKYLACYSDKFSPPDNMDLITWKKKRAASLSRPKFINVVIKGPIIEALTEEELLITFSQTFQSDVYQDTVIKSLTMVKEISGWKILAERTVQEVFP